MAGYMQGTNSYILAQISIIILTRATWGVSPQIKVNRKSKYAVIDWMDTSHKALAWIPYIFRREIKKKRNKIMIFSFPYKGDPRKNEQKGKRKY